jgi:hypothetical protein
MFHSDQNFTIPVKQRKRLSVWNYIEYRRLSTYLIRINFHKTEIMEKDTSKIKVLDSDCSDTIEFKELKRASEQCERSCISQDTGILAIYVKACNIHGNAFNSSVFRAVAHGLEVPLER